MKLPPEAVAIEADMDFDACVALCVELGLMEAMTHGEHQYARITQKGRNCFSAMLRLSMNATDPDARLSPT